MHERTKNPPDTSQLFFSYYSLSTLLSRHKDELFILEPKVRNSWMRRKSLKISLETRECDTQHIVTDSIPHTANFIQL